MTKTLVSVVEVHVEEAHPGLLRDKLFFLTLVCDCVATGEEWSLCYGGGELTDAQVCFLKSKLVGEVEIDLTNWT